jgi:hypothetical protein
VAGVALTRYPLTRQPGTVKHKARGVADHPGVGDCSIVFRNRRLCSGIHDVDIATCDDEYLVAIGMFVGARVSTNAWGEIGDPSRPPRARTTHAGGLLRPAARKKHRP